MLNNDLDHIIQIAERYDVLAKKLPVGKLASKQDYQTMLVLLRSMIRASIDLYNDFSDELRYYTRQKKKLEAQGFKVPLLDAQIESKKEYCKAFREALIQSGERLQCLLDCWQQAGATREELFNLCNSHRLKNWEKEKLAMEEREEFSGLVFIYNLDYPDDGKEWIDDATDAPFTHATKEFMLYQMKNTRAGRKAAREAMEAIFPEILEKALTMTTDAEGDWVLIDKDGETVANFGDTPPIS